MKQYNLPILIILFDQHAKIAEKEREKSIDKFRKEYPDVDLPSQLEDDFNLPAALSCMCQHILARKTRSE